MTEIRNGSTRYSLKETANIVRRCLKEAFPGVKFSVRTEQYSMGSSINVRWTDGPLDKAVESLIGRFQYSGSMQVDDYVTSLEHEIGGQTVKFGAKHVSCHREISNAVRQAVNSLDDGELITLARRLDCKPRAYDIDAEGKLRWRDEFAGYLAHMLPIWKGEQQPCAFAESVSVAREF